MKSLRLAVAVVLFVAFAVPALAQGEKNPEEIFKYFPKGKYQEINYFNLEMMRAEKGWPLYKELYMAFGDRYQLESKLPEVLFKEVKSFVNGGIVTKIESKKLNKVVKESFPDFGDLPRTDVNFMAPINGYYYHFFGNCNNLYVFEFADSSTALAEAVKDGKLDKTDKLIDGKSLYILTHKNDKGEASDYFLLETEPGEVVMANSIQSLKQMLETSKGLAPSLLEDQEYHQLSENFDLFTPSWEMMNFRVGQDLVVKKMVELKAPEEEINKREEMNAGTSLFTVSGIDMSKGVARVNLEIYDGTLEAEKAFAEKKEEALDDWQVSKEGNVVKIVDPTTENEIQAYRVYIAKEKAKKAGK